MHTLELGLSERRCVAGDDDELGLAGAKGLERGLVAESDLAGLRCCQEKFLRNARLSLRTLIVNASLALMLSAVLLLFLGAIASDCCGCDGRQK